MAHGDLAARWTSFGWHVITVEDGNDSDQLNGAFEQAKEYRGRPAVILANTVKGCGSRVMENKASWHHHVPSAEEYEEIMKDFRERREACADE